jgi:hypothetical protein
VVVLKSSVSLLMLCLLLSSLFYYCLFLPSVLSVLAQIFEYSDSNCIYIIFFFFWLYSVLNSGPVLARQALYYLIHTVSPFCFTYFLNGSQVYVQDSPLSCPAIYMLAV